LILFPAIDVKDGRCVRLEQGDFDRATTFADDPAEQAIVWEKAGASFIHVVDLDGAREGTGRNEPVVAKIAASVSIPIQVGGGIRCMADAEKKLALGVARIILGTAAVRDPDFVREAVRVYGGDKIVVGVDAKNGRVAVQGWGELSEIEADELCARIRDIGIRSVVYTDIAKDGMMAGPNLAATRKIVELGNFGEFGELGVIASGGIASLSDLRAVRDIGAVGAIIGKALYRGAIDLKEAIALFEKLGK
jgi:phosphoribosylformimino-5-aminoimidazole carboxamide ribotide isomerase